ncbi:MAG: hypothetical protein O2992_06870 [Gemmatimonadetes bacterium]|jgi:hypothetical protein|nr:hypothetical protein [Gemmatimonadota bacterium]
MTLTRLGSAAAALLVVVSFAACAPNGDKAATGTPDGAGVLPPGHVPLGESGATAAGGDAATVTVLETMNSGGYTYARVSDAGGESWLAGPETELDVGQALWVSGAMPMENFTSSTLDRTFDLIFFVGGFQRAPAMASAAGTTPGTTPGTAPVGGVQGTVSEVLVGGGYTYVAVETDGVTRWLAGPMTPVEEGQVISWKGGMTMNGFTSSTLERTFDEILFVERILLVK